MLKYPRLESVRAKDIDLIHQLFIKGKKLAKKCEAHDDIISIIDLCEQATLTMIKSYELDLIIMSKNKQNKPSNN